MVSRLDLLRVALRSPPGQFRTLATWQGPSRQRGVPRPRARRYRRGALFFFHLTLSRLQQNGDSAIPHRSRLYRSPSSTASPTLRRASQEDKKIVAIGSSTTAGEGNIKPYPDWLLCFLRDEYPNAAITMANRGISGEEAPIELKRFDTDVIAQKAALPQLESGHLD
jgi:hypothetical protein